MVFLREILLAGNEWISEQMFIILKEFPIIALFAFRLLPYMFLFCSIHASGGSKADSHVLCFPTLMHQVTGLIPMPSCSSGRKNLPCPLFPSPMHHVTDRLNSHALLLMWQAKSYTLVSYYLPSTSLPACLGGRLKSHAISLPSCSGGRHNSHGLPGKRERRSVARTQTPSVSGLR